MSGFVLRVDDVILDVEGPDDLAEILDELALTPNRTGSYGRAYWLAPVTDTERPRWAPALRVDLDPQTGAGAARWLDGDLTGVESGYEAQVVIVSEAPGEPLVWVPPTIARASYAAARASVLRYVETGRRPGNLRWIEG